MKIKWTQSHKRGLNKGVGKPGGRARGAHGQQNKRQSHVLRHKTNKDTLNKDRRDMTVRAGP